MHGSRPLRALLAIAVFAAGATDARAPDRHVRVLLLSEFDPATPLNIAFTTGLRTELDPAKGYGVYLEYLDRFRYPTPMPAAEVRDWLRSRYALTPPDVVVALGDEVTQLLADVETAPWPGVPVVFSGIDGRVVADRELPPTFTGITENYAVRETVELALRLFPKTRYVALVGGASATDELFAGLARRDLATLAGRVDVIDLVGLPTPSLLERLASLPDDSIVLGSAYLRDGAGQVWNGQLIAPRISAAARGPLFSAHGTVLGYGAVGGAVVDYQGAGGRAGEIVRRVLAGEPPSSIRIEDSGTNRTVLDGRQLDRWGVPDSRVPEGAEIRFREPSLWHRYRWALIAGISAFVVQALLIVGLLVERRRRRRAEARFRENLAVVAHLNRVGAIGEMAGAFAHELNSPLGAVVNNAQAARRFLLAGPERGDEVAACLDDIVGDARRAGEVVRRMRGHLRREDVEPVQVDVSAVIRDAVHLVAMDARDRGVDLTVDVSPGLPTLRGDDVQLVQVVLNLVVNALDAVRDEPRERRRVRVGASPSGHGVEIQVADTGPGIPPAQAQRVFEPFFTTKKVGLGLGLAITRSIVEAHGGTITASPAEGRGSVFRVVLPAAPAAAPPRAPAREAAR
jgi:signal transduction histidine kinase